MPTFPQKIEVLGLTGEFASGKTLFGLSIDPAKTLVYDAEKSAGTYEALGFTRIDIPREMQARSPKGYKPIDTFTYWWNHVKSVPAGRFSVIGLDPVSEIESGLADWVMANPSYFGKTAAQYLKSGGLFWGDVKELWKLILSDLASRCETFYFTSHLTSVWQGSAPVPGRRKPKGKETLMELASLYLLMERKPDANGAIPAKPSAIVLKSRLATTALNADGDVSIVPTLPPRLAVATPAEIRRYMRQPPNYAALKPEELAPEPTVSEDERAAIRLATAEAERDAAAIKLEISRGAGAGEIDPTMARLQAVASEAALAQEYQNRVPDEAQRSPAPGLAAKPDQADAVRPQIQGENMNAIAEGWPGPQQASAPSVPAAPSEPRQNPIAPRNQDGTIAAAPKEVTAGFPYPKTPAVAAFCDEAARRGSFDELAPLFKTIPKIVLDWEIHSTYLHLALCALRVSADHGHVGRVGKWVEAQRRDSAARITERMMAVINPRMQDRVEELNAKG